MQDPIGTVSTLPQLASEELQPAFKPLMVTELEVQEEAKKLVVEEPSPIVIPFVEEGMGVFAFVNAVIEKPRSDVQEESE